MFRHTGQLHRYEGDMPHRIVFLMLAIDCYSTTIVDVQKAIEKGIQMGTAKGEKEVFFR